MIHKSIGEDIVQSDVPEGPVGSYADIPGAGPMPSINYSGITQSKEAEGPSNMFASLPGAVPAKPVLPKAPTPLGPGGLTPEQDRALPRAPEGFEPGVLSMKKGVENDSLLFKIGNVLSSMGKEGIPASIRLQKAQAEADQAVLENKLAIANYFKTNEIARQAMQQHNMDSFKQFMSMIPQFKAQLSSLGKDITPEDKEAFISSWRQYGDSAIKGGGRVVDLISQNLHQSYTLDYYLNHPDPNVKAQFQELAGTLGYDNMLGSPQMQALTNKVAADWFSSIANTTSVKNHIAKGKGDYHEADFLKDIDETALQQQIHPLQIQAIKAYMDTEVGQRHMASLGITPSSATLAQLKKQKEQGYAAELKDMDLKQVQSDLEFAKQANEKVPGSVPQATIDALQVRKDQHLGLAAKTPGAGQFSENNKFGYYLADVSNQEFKDPTTMFEGIAPGTKEFNRRKEIYSRALKAMPAAGPMAQQDVKMAAPHNFVEHPVYEMKGNRIVPVNRPMSEGEYRTFQGGFTMSAAQKEHVTKIDAAEEGGTNLFKAAQTAYSGKTWWERTKETAAESVLTTPPGESIFGQMITDQLKQKTAAAYPKLAAYIAQRDAVLGTYAKGLGGETGVLTNQDIDRVRKLFSAAYDTPEIRKAKEQAFQKIIDLNRRAVAGVLSSDKDATDISTSQWKVIQEQNRDTVNGILGSVEDKVRRASIAPEGAQPKSAGQSLIDEIRAGKR